MVELWLKVRDTVLKIGAGLLAILALVFYVKKQKDDKLEAEAKLETAESDKKDAVLAQKQEDIQKRIAEEQARAEEEKKHKMTQQESEEFLKKL